MVNAAFLSPPFGFAIPTGNWVWREIFPTEFVKQLTVEPLTHKLLHEDPTFQSLLLFDKIHVLTPKTKPILMTEAVWNGYKAARPNADAVTKAWFRPITLSLPAYTGKVYAGDVIKTAFRE